MCNWPVVVLACALSSSTPLSCKENYSTKVLWVALAPSPGTRVIAVLGKRMLSNPLTPITGAHPPSLCGMASTTVMIKGADIHRYMLCKDQLAVCSLCQTHAWHSRED